MIDKVRRDILAMGAAATAVETATDSASADSAKPHDRAICAAPPRPTAAAPVQLAPGSANSDD